MNSRPARKADDYEEYQVDSPRKNRGHWIKKAKLFQTENAMTCKYKYRNRCMLSFSSILII